MAIEVLTAENLGSYFINNCLFQNNNMTDQYCRRKQTYKSPLLWSNNYHGGGINIILAGNSSNNSFVIANCNFTNISAVWGGGVYLQLQNSTSNNNITISNLSFYRNEVLKEGGGLDIAFLSCTLQTPYIFKIYHLNAAEQNMEVVLE